MKASEAKRRADQVCNDRNNTEYRTVMGHIERAVDEGSYSISLDGISYNTRRLLEQDGYTVDSFSDPRERETTYTIKWSK